MALVRPAYEELVERATRILQALTPINQFHESSVAGAIVRMAAALLSQLYDLLEQLDRDVHVSTAQGLALDRIGQTFGVVRRPPRRATTFGSASPLKFTNNSSADVVVPAGTLVWSRMIPAKRYRTVESVTVPAGGEAYVHAIADGDGASYNADTNEIDAHNLNNPNIMVTNVAPLMDAEDMESDESYRARILNTFMRRYYGSATAISEALMDHPGVVDVQLFPLRRGPGTLDVLVVPTVMPASSEFIQSIQTVLEEEVVPGIDWRLIVPEPTPVDVLVRIQMRGGWDPAIVESVRQVVRGAIDNRLEVLVVNELLSRIMDISTQVLDADVEIFVDGVRIERQFVPEVMQILRTRRVDVEPMVG